MRRKTDLLWVLVPMLLLVLVVFLLRPLGIIHGPLMLLYKYPLFWLAPSAVFLAIIIPTKLYQVIWKKQGKEYKSLPHLWPLAVAAGLTTMFVAFIVTPILTNNAIYQHYKPLAENSLPESGETRIMPKAIADVLARNGFSSPTEKLTNPHIISSPAGLLWTFGQSPDGLYRKIVKKTEGTATLPANITKRQLRLQSKRYQVGPGQIWADSVTWKAYKEHYWSEVAESIFLPDINKILVPYIGYRGFPIRIPYLKGAYLVSPDGSLKDMTPDEARSIAAVQRAGRLYPESLVRKIENSYQYVHGIWNRLFTHRDVLTVSGSGRYLGNPQPSYLRLGGRSVWVTVAEPWGMANAIGGIFFFDALSGSYRLWRPDPRAGLTSANRAIDATKALVIPGVSFQSGDFKAIEPRPVFRNSQIFFLVSIVPGTGATVSKSAIVDPRTNKVIALFSHDTDPEADRKLALYLEGEIEGGSPQKNKKQDLLEELLSLTQKQKDLLEELLAK